MKLKSFHLLLLAMTALLLTGCDKGNNGANQGNSDHVMIGNGSLSKPYATSDVIYLVASNKVLADKVYIKGKISRIADGGTYAESGSLGVASYYISDDGKTGNELFVDRSLYFNGEAYTGGQDIQKGDEVIIYGIVKKDSANRPVTETEKCWLFSLNGQLLGK